jgi:hypothetical protein
MKIFRRFTAVLIPWFLFWMTSGSLAAAPFSGRNMYAPHLPWFSFPGDSAAPLEDGRYRVRSGVYLMNEFSSYPFNPEDHTLDADGRLSEAEQEEFTAIDYESTVLELGFDWQALSRWRFSVDWRLHARYGGFTDPAIEWWHDVLGASNAGREYFDVNRSQWNIKTGGGAMEGSGTVIAPGDIDLRTVWSFYQGKKIVLGAGAAFKIPTGELSGGFSSGYPDLAFEFLVNWNPWKRWSFYADTGVIFPLGGEGRIMGQLIPVVEFRASKGLSILLQMNIQSSPVTSDKWYDHPTFGPTTMFSLPQTDLKIGLKGQAGQFGWQFYIEEDPLTWEGPDILMFFGADWSIR